MSEALPRLTSYNQSPDNIMGSASLFYTNRISTLETHLEQVKTKLRDATAKYESKIERLKKTLSNQKTEHVVKIYELECQVKCKT